jgi:hypothetical protein
MIGAGVPAELLKAAQGPAAGAATIGAKGPAAPAEPKLTAAAAQPQAKLGGATHRKVPEAADTKRSAPPPKTAAAAPPKEVASPQAKLKTPALGSPPAKAAAPQIDPKAASHTGPKLGVPQTNPKAAPVQPAAAAVDATANTDEPPPPTKSPSVRAVMNVPISQPPEAQFAATQAALPGPPPRPPSVQRREPSIEAEAEVVPTPAVVVQAEHAPPRYLPGDPMAPQVASPMRAPRTKIPGDEDITVPREERAWLYWTVCGTVVLVVVLLAFGLFR